MHRSLLIPERPLRPGGPSRFAQLAIVRGHGAHALGADGTERAAERRDRFLVDAVVGRPRIGLPGEVSFHNALDDDLPALRAALQRTVVEQPSWAGPALVAGLTNYWYYRAKLMEGARWLRAAAAHLALARPIDAAVLHASLVALHGMTGTLSGARPHVEAFLAAADHATGDDLVAIGDWMGALVSPIRPSGDPALMRELAVRAVDVAERSGDPHHAYLSRAATLLARPLAVDEHVHAATDLHIEALRAGSRAAAWICAASATAVCVAAGDVESALGWAERGARSHLALGAQDAPQLMELVGGLHARRGDAEMAVRVLAGAREQNRRAGMRWPNLPDTTALLAAAADQLDPAVYERAWQEGGRLRLADIAGLAEP